MKGVRGVGFGDVPAFDDMQTHLLRQTFLDIEYRVPGTHTRGSVGGTANLAAAEPWRGWATDPAPAGTQTWHRRTRRQR